MLTSVVLSVVVAVIFQLAYPPRAFTPDFTLTAYSYILCTQIVQASSIVSACAPYLAPFFESLQSGLFWVNDVERLEINHRTTNTYSSKLSAPQDARPDDYVEIDSLDRERNSQT